MALDGDEVYRTVGVGKTNTAAARHAGGKCEYVLRRGREHLHVAGRINQGVGANAGFGQVIQQRDPKGAAERPDGHRTVERGAASYRREESVRAGRDQNGLARARAGVEFIHLRCVADVGAGFI